MDCSEGHYVIQVVTDPSAVAPADWDGLLDAQPDGQASGPFMRHAYLLALHTSGSATPQTGWSPHWVLVWHNRHPAEDGRPFVDFEDFLASLSQDKRKKIRQERRKVADAGIRFSIKRGQAIAPDDWAFFIQCYERTYWEHGNPPYLAPAFFQSMATELADFWLLCTAQGADGRPIACSLVALSDASLAPQAAYGRYWGALQRIDCLHFVACYYQPLEWCIAHGVNRFEGGAQGEHKMARALLPTATHSAHWLAHPALADAVDRFLEREGKGVHRYLEHLETRNPFRTEPPRSN